jgi:hypothetical protein
LLLRKKTTQVWIIFQGKFEVAKKLIEAGADVNLVSAVGKKYFTQ